MKCSICSKKIEETFLKKIVGSQIKKEGSGKLYPVCPECQKKFPKKEDQLKEMK